MGKPRVSRFSSARSWCSASLDLQHTRTHTHALAHTHQTHRMHAHAHAHAPMEAGRLAGWHARSRARSVVRRTHAQYNRARRSGARAMRVRACVHREGQRKEAREALVNVRLIDGVGGGRSHSWHAMPVVALLFDAQQLQASVGSILHSTHSTILHSTHSTILRSTHSTIASPIGMDGAPVPMGCSAYFGPEQVLHTEGPGGAGWRTSKCPYSALLVAGTFLRPALLVTPVTGSSRRRRSAAHQTPNMPYDQQCLSVRACAHACLVRMRGCIAARAWYLRGAACCVLCALG